jgi:hypothetical protein
MWAIFGITIAFIWVLALSYNLGVLTKQIFNGVKGWDAATVIKVILLAPFLAAAHIGCSLEEFNLNYFNKKEE